jgi:glycosyltransferase involved in cell wall biosynthesis
MDKKGTILFVTDTPTPYRMHLYRALAHEFNQFGIRFAVWFMSRRVSNRNWSVQGEKQPFEMRTYESFPIRYNDFVLHLNFKLPLQIFLDRRRLSAVVVGGSWNSPTSVLCVLLCRISKIPVFFWAEANRHSASLPHGLVRPLRNWVLGLCRGFVIPGKAAEDTIKDVWGLNKPLFYLTNIIDERKIILEDPIPAKCPAQIEIIFSVNWRRVYLIVARLYEKDKGVLNFLRSIDGLLRPDSLILICGEGEDRQVIAEWIQGKGSKNIILLGWVDPAYMPYLYRRSDVFILPSFRDPYPLSAVEALWTGMALLVSHRCGNAEDVVVRNINGELFDPERAEEIQTVFGWMESASDEQVTIMKAQSLRLAEERYSTSVVVSRFVRSLLSNFGIK